MSEALGSIASTVKGKGKEGFKKDRNSLSGIAPSPSQGYNRASARTTPPLKTSGGPPVSFYSIISRI
jgi:hypothetical protein